ncbi:formate dehydrogenase subunit alpha [Acidithrix ferrooxidans]|uniref:Putative formate dehydrogenase n=2 Tax=root TaxID=1 RepID=A0A0D8HF53_9ACTN|nr:formate dehydrogenase subunit alpha [Acidithrix ferrooxidans]KJF16595.1 putative formate dehydrogenase [Acidithrix ferrooxidans]
MEYGQEISITINGIEATCRVGELLIDVVNRYKQTLPQICYNEVLGPIRTCDTCFVEVDSKLVRACDSRVSHAMAVLSDSPSAKAAQIEAISRVLHNHDLYCTLCENNNGNCVIHNTISASGIKHPKYEFEAKPYEIDASHPFYRYDPSQCILCGRCVEACQDLQVNETLSIDWSLERPRVIWDDGVLAGESSCVGCGHCVTVCPCNALIEKSMLGEAGFLSGLPSSLTTPMIALTKAAEPATGIQSVMAISEMESRLRGSQIKKTKTVCTYCGVGCSFEVWTKGRKILKVEPSDGPTNAVSTCVKGKFGWDYINSKERLTTPLIRDGEGFRETSWDEAISYIARRMREIKGEAGADALGFISSSKCTNEESYLMQKLARAVVGTNNIDNCSRYCQSPATMGLWRTVGIGGDSGSVTDIEAAGLVIIIGSNTAESHPVIATRIKRSHKLKGQRLIVADLRRHEMAERADIFLHPKPGTDLVWLSGVTRYIYENNLADQEFLTSKVENLENYIASLEPFDLETTSNITGISKETLIEVANEIVSAKGVVICWAMGVTQHNGGSDTSTAISNLLLITGNYGKPGCGSYPLRGHNNVQGASDFGSMPAMMPGYEKLSDPVVVAKWERQWGVDLPKTAGLDNHEMVDAIHSGSLKALYLIGEDMGLVDANINHVQSAFEKLELFVVQDIFFSKTAQFADVILPASPSLEKEGTFTNTERRIQRLYQALEPLGESRPDWKIITSIGNALGANWSYGSPEEIMDEASRCAEIFVGVTYGALEGFSSLQWPVKPDGSDTPVLFLDGFAFPSGKAQLYPLEFIEPSEVTDDEFDLHVNNGRLLEHFHEGNMTYKSQGISSRTPGTFLEVSPELAKERNLSDGSVVRLTSRRGAVKVSVLISDRVQGREVYLPMNSQSNESAINALTSSHTDRATHTPAYKELAVKMEVLSAKGKSPLPKNNFRNGVRNPQMGVLVESKWERSDYVEPSQPRKDGGL